jgi:hypothetical protein
VWAYPVLIERGQEVFSFFLYPRLTPLNGIGKKCKDGMHHLAEWEVNEENIGQQDVHYQNHLVG